MDVAMVAPERSGALGFRPPRFRFPGGGGTGRGGEEKRRKEERGGPGRTWHRPGHRESAHGRVDTGGEEGEVGEADMGVL